jgi:hypothetical protein
MKTYSQFISETSTSERTRRRSFLRGPSSDKRERTQQRRNVLDRSALQKAGFKKSPNRDHYAQDHQISSSSSHETNVGTYQNQSDFAKQNVLSKVNFGAKSVKPTSKRVSHLRALRKQMKTTRTPRQVHDVSIHTKGDQEPTKNDSKELITRGKSFHQELSNLSSNVKKVGGKSSDIVVATPMAVMKGENQKEGKRKREKIYQKQFKTEPNQRTGFMMGRVS